MSSSCSSTDLGIDTDFDDIVCFLLLLIDKLFFFFS